MSPEWNCLQPSVIYQATAKIKNKPESLLSLLRTYRRTMGEGNYEHKFLFNNKKYAHSTALSKNVWDCKDNVKQTPEISWKIIISAPAYTNTSKRCTLCMEEKMAIITYPNQEKLLNKRSDLISKRRQENKFLLKYHLSPVGLFCECCRMSLL